MIAVEPVGNIAVIRLDRAAKRNALTPTMLASLAGAVDRAGSAHAIVLSGVGEVFCAGFDLDAAQGDESVLRDLLTSLSRAVRTLRDAPSPVVVSAHGAAMAGGCALLCGGDFVVTNAAAKLGYPAVKLGISPAVSAPNLRAGIGDGAARVRMLDPGVVDGQQAVRLGLASECVAAVADCEPRAIALARELAAKPRHALAYTKRWLNELDGSLDERALAAALEASLAGVGTGEQRALLAAIWNKEPQSTQRSQRKEKGK